MIAEGLIDGVLSEKVRKGQVLSGKQIAALDSRQHIYVDGKHALVVDVNVNFRTKTVELIYIKGRKFFGREIYADYMFDDRPTNVRVGILIDDDEDY